jgi:hypothetical protein
VLSGFRTWRERHEDRVTAAEEEFLSKTGVVGSWEKEVQKLSQVRDFRLHVSAVGDLADNVA